MIRQSQRIYELLGAVLNMKAHYPMVSKNEIHNLCEDGIEQSVTRDHIPSLGKPPDAKQ